MSYYTQIGQDLLNVPMGDMIRDMAFAIAEAQTKLDENSITVAEMMGGLKTIYNNEGDVAFEDSRVFFGRDRVPLSVAKALYNCGTNKAGYKSLCACTIVNVRIRLFPKLLSISRYYHRGKN